MTYLTKPKLHHPKLPDIPGRGTFVGAAFHSARWDDAVDLRAKRVAVIGTGSTGVQIVIVEFNSDGLIFDANDVLQ